VSIWDSIKGERRLTLDHWRYRLLHWTFRVEKPNPQKPEASGLPKFLYTHYCPLFHLTNLIVILLPLLIPIRVTLFLIGLVVSLLSFAGRTLLSVLDLIPIQRMVNFLISLLPEPKEKEKPKPNPKSEWRLCRLLTDKYHAFDEHGTFDGFWTVYANQFSALNREEVELVFGDQICRILAKKKAEEARQQRLRERREVWRQRIIFWSGVSSMLIKGILNISYVVAGIMLLYGIYEFGPAVGSGLWSMVTWAGNGIADGFASGWHWCINLFVESNWGSLLKGLQTAGIITGSLLGAYFVILLLVRIGLIQWVANFLLKWVLAPAGVALLKMGEWLAAGWSSVTDFVSMFYEENCPPIKIITEEKE
jgi:hypothetical protein